MKKNPNQVIGRRCHECGGYPIITAHLTGAQHWTEDYCDRCYPGPNPRLIYAAERIADGQPVPLPE